jgi:hypothetical protein
VDYAIEFMTLSVVSFTWIRTIDPIPTAY